MRNITKYIVLAMIAVVGFMQTSCNEFLEMPLISSAVNIDTVFSTRVKAESFLWNTYRQVIPSGFPLRANAAGIANLPLHRCIKADITDECDYPIAYASGPEINVTGYEPNVLRHMEVNYSDCYKGIRKAFIFKENIDKVPDIPQNEKIQMKMECNILIALGYHVLVRSHGGVPLIKQSVSPNDDLLQISRSSFEDCVNYIVELCDEAIDNPLTVEQYPTQWRGRVTRGVALAIKARTLLYAASPLYNTSNPPISYGNANDVLIAYMNYDKERWKKAVDANKALLDWAAGLGKLSLINTGNPFVDFSVATSQEDNSEIILSNKAVGDGSAGTDGFTRFYLPHTDQTQFNKGNSITFNGLVKFYKNDGTEQTWPTLNETRPFDEYKTKMHEMEPRLLATAWPFGEASIIAPNRYKTWNFKSLPGSSQGNHHGTAVLLKFCYDYQGQAYKEFPVFRLAEFYLNYAEALNEYNSTPPQEAYDALNLIRQRGGLPLVDKTDSRYNTTDKFRLLLQRERFIELFAEDHRIYDVRRWRIAHNPGVIGGPMLMFELTQDNSGNPQAYTTYTTKVYRERFWMNKLYFHPFPQTEVDKGSLLQNPGY